LLLLAALSRFTVKSKKRSELREEDKIVLVPAQNSPMNGNENGQPVEAAVLPRPTPRARAQEGEVELAKS